jgi:hypothetical protein
MDPLFVSVSPKFHSYIAEPSDPMVLHTWVDATNFLSNQPQISIAYNVSS